MIIGSAVHVDLYIVLSGANSEGPETKVEQKDVCARGKGEGFIINLL